MRRNTALRFAYSENHADSDTVSFTGFRQYGEIETGVDLTSSQGAVSLIV